MAQDKFADGPGCGQPLSLDDFISYCCKGYEATKLSENDNIKIGLSAVLPK